jgi:hypothetical protein
MAPIPWLRVLGPIAAFGLGLATATPGIADEGDPPERVAVVDLVEGAAAAQPAGIGDWTADLANRPLTSGDKVWVDANSRAEMHLGSAAIRLGANTALQFLNVADRGAQLRLSTGSMNVRLRYLSPDETFEVDTPNSAVSLVQAGEYRIDVNEAGDAVAVAVWGGLAEIAGQTQSFTLQAQQEGEFHGVGTLGVEFNDLPPPDELDQWAQSRDQREDELLTANFLSRDVSGYADLDGYGEWQTDSDVGPVWLPQVQAGWVPYSQGYWIWVAPWGWTWIDAAPWGFAPFHYGRWVHIHSGWAWSPGQLSVRPVYAPALVAWATGPNSELAWTALGYNEIYRPSMHVSNAYLQRVNVTNTYIGNTAILDSKTIDSQSRHANQAVPGAMIAVTQETFTSAREVNRDPIHILASQALARASNPVVPTARSFVHAAGNPRNAAVMPPRAIFARPVVARTRPPGAHGPGAEQPHVILTNVPRAEAMSRPAARSPPAVSSPNASPPARESGLPRVFPPASEARPGRDFVPGRSPQSVGQPENRSDRPAVMPRPPAERSTPEKPLPEHPAAEHPAAERPAPAADSRERTYRTDHPTASPPSEAAPPVRKESPPVEPPRKAPEKSPY